MTSPIATQDTTSQPSSSPHLTQPDGGASAQPRVHYWTSKAAQLRWLALNTLCGAILGVLIYHGDTLARLAIRLAT